MATRISLSDFTMKRLSYGYYEVTYTSPKTQKTWSTRTHDSCIIDDTFGSEDPTQKNLRYLLYMVKNM